MILALANTANYVESFFFFFYVLCQTADSWEINANLSCELLKQGHEFILSQNQQAVLPKRLSLLMKCCLVGGIKKYKTSELRQTLQSL